MQIRVHELAKELKISTMALKKHLTDLGVITKSHMSIVDGKVADEIRRKYNEQIDAEKRAEKERRKLIEMRRKARKSGAKAKTPQKKAKKEEEIPIPKAKAKEKAPETDKDAKAPKDKETREVQKDKKPRSHAEIIKDRIKKTREEAKKRRDDLDIRVPFEQATPTPRKRQPRAKTTDRSRRAPRISTPPPPPPPMPLAPDAGKKFAKDKPVRDEAEELSRRKKAAVARSRRSRKSRVDILEADEATISRNIKKVMQKTTKRKKYRREAQSVQDSGQEIVVREFTSVSELGRIMNVTPAEIISKFFMMGQLVTINQRLDKDSLEMICDEFGVEFCFEDEYGTDLIELKQEKFTDVPEEPRPPVVTIMGHVDHGKTSILDYIRNENIVAGESGGITQHMGAYQIEVNKHKITFLDTPGHEAFTAMRARGANVTDIAVIVVAATEGVKPQTKEAIDHAKAAGVSMIFALNKIDLPEANVDLTLSQIMENGVYLEQYGGEVPWCKTSTVTGEGILNLIELILLSAEMMELTAKRDIPAEAIVVEAEMDPRMGSITTVLVQKGTLKKGDIIVCGAVNGRVRRMENERGKEILELGPSDVARVYGLAGTPKAGDVLNQVDDERTARSISSEREQIRHEREKYQSKSSLQNIFARIKEEQISTLNLILKTDADGSAEAIADSLEKLGNEEVSVNIIHKSVGGIREADVSLASASDAVILGFHVRAGHEALRMAEEEGVQIYTYQVIYDAIEDVRKALEGMLEPDIQEQSIGSARVKQVFKVKKVGTIAGCQVERGIIKRDCLVRIYRNDVLVAEDSLSSLKRYADDVKEVRAGTECGMSFEKFADIKEGDVIEAYVMKEVAKKLS